MGKAIVYCQVCGLSLHEQDFERGKAVRIDNRPYCAKCRAPEALPKPAPTPPPTPSRRISDRVPVVRPPNTPRPFKPAPPRSPAVLWGSLLFIAVVGAVGLTLALAGRKPLPEPVTITEPTPLPTRPSPPTPPPPTVDKDVDLLRRLLAGPPGEWKRDEIDAALARRPELAGPRKEYARGLLGLGLLEGLVGHWTLDEKDGAVARDVSGRGYDGKVIGAPLRVSGKVGGAYRFQGNGEDGVELPSVNELDLVDAKSFTLSAWFQPDQVPAGPQDTSNDAWYALLIRSGMHMGLCYDRGGRVELAYWIDGPKKAFHVTTQTAAPGSWAHVAGVVDASAGRTRVVLNGKPAGETAWTPRVKTHYVRSTWRVGIGIPQAKEYGWSLKGAVDDVRFHARALADEEIALLAEGTALPTSPAPGGRTPSNEGLILHLRGDAGVGAVNGVVNTWADVERKVVTHAEEDERPSWRDGRIVLDGRDDRVVYHGVPEHAFKESDSFTLRAKVHLDAVPKRWTGVFSKSIERGTWYGLWIDPEGRWVFGSPLNLHGSPAKTGLSTVTAVQIGGKERRLYVDGVRVATGPAFDGSGTGDLWIGGVKGRGEYLNGAILEIRLWRRALEPAEVIAK